MKRIFFYLLVLGFCSCASIKTSFDYDINTDFSQFKTFAFFKPGIDKAKISDLDKRRIMSSIETTLSMKGYVASENPQLLVSFHTDAEKNINIHENYYGLGMFHHYGPHFGWGAFRPYNIYSNTSGILYVDIIDYNSKKLVWQGKAIGFIKEGSPEEKIEKISQFISKIFEQYPPQND